MKYADIIEFIESEVGSQVRLRMDCETEDIVAECECCKARGGPAQMTETFEFSHAVDCSCSGDGGNGVGEFATSGEVNDRFFDLAEKLGKVLESEPDDRLGLFVSAFVSGVACDVSADKTGESVDSVATRFVGDFRSHLAAVTGAFASESEGVSLIPRS